jgi:hypothetical protein
MTIQTPPPKLDKTSYTKDEVEALLKEAVHPFLEENTKLKAYSKQLAAHIQNTVAAPAQAEPADMPDSQAAIAELREVSRHMEQAVNDIISRTQKMERMLATYLFPEKQKLIDELMRMLEACNVHDITTQRLMKVRGMLGDKSVPPNYRPQHPGAQRLESGPQMPGQAITQAEIDRLLNS